MKLALFFTFGLSLKQWLDTGLFGREKLLYEKLLHKQVLSKVLWITYGTEDSKIAEQLKQEGKLHADIEVIKIPGLFGVPLKNFLQKVDVLMTNQMSGSWSAVLAKKTAKKPLIIRTGYTWSRLKESQNTSVLKKIFIKRAETFAYKNCDLAVLSTQSQAEFIKNRFKITEENIYVIPNYIDINLFKPDSSVEKYPDRLLYVGRISKEKNLFNLVSAAAQADMQLDVYGAGSLRKELKDYADRTNARLTFKGSIANNLLPQVMNRYKFFVLPSLHESLPKSLLEAMACGLVCIGTDVTGINEVISDGIDGYLAENTDSNSIFEAIKKAKSNPAESICSSAVETIKNKYSLEYIVGEYSRLLEKIKNAC
ncbi:MAG: glycosyltransferase family 4 protein [Sedimentisphaerales bacterium]|nr:glycosyltransferase family 4 protein [Sedimentisphaerales bacterium]